MESLFRYIAPPSPCGYLPDERWSLEYEMVAGLTGEEYTQRLDEGWRRFGAMLFRPRCPNCQACQSLRIDATKFEPNRSQRRALKKNQESVELQIVVPSVTREKLRLYDRFHDYQTDSKDWPEHPAKDAASYRESFVHNPEFTEEWCYFIDQRLVGVGYVDRLPNAFSAIYFYYDPDYRDRALGTYNVLRLIEECRRHERTYLYLGYYVQGCRSLEYKANFRPNQVLSPAGIWCDFLT